MQIIIVKSEDFVVFCIVFLEKSFWRLWINVVGLLRVFFAQINEWSRRLKTLDHGWEFLLIIGLERALFCVMQRDFIREFLSLFLQKGQFSQVYQKNKVFSKNHQIEKNSRCVFSLLFSENASFNCAIFPFL